jgi:hypothetical protein
MIFDSGTKATYEGKTTFFIKWYWSKRRSVNHKTNLVPSLIPYIIMNSKWVVDLKVKCKTIKLLENM